MPSATQAPPTVDQQAAAVQVLLDMGYRFEGGRWLPRRSGRPMAPIDLPRAQQLIAEGTSVRNTAARLGISEATLRGRLAAAARDTKEAS